MASRKPKVNLNIRRREVHNEKCLGLRLSKRSVAELDALCKDAGDVEYSTLLRHLIREKFEARRR